ncbi:MAG: hypothetical protein HZA61_08580 [Candidatus Eisenbacteria bacterium]|uniref:Uncharacterized protein n=1 Tax=Eiseniibacteriota bacterium TaxID=2212470 RepID=A0A933W347_UNCEI|nr:hypothetical protein [Candidatus Eisenbacteria bacterium]
MEVVERNSVAAPERLLSSEAKAPIPTLKLRVRDDVGLVVQVFLKGETRGHVDVGDRVRVDGHDRGGVIVAENIFNETTQSWVNDRSRCFIATACAGEGSSEVAVLRAFRDRRLRRTAAGRLFIACYERLSPPVARLVARHEWLRRFVRATLVHPLAVGIGRREDERAGD